MLTAEPIVARARELGFDLCGIAPAADFPELRLLREWLDRGHAGEMHYMHRTAEARADVRRVLPSARSVVVTGTVYNTDRPYSIERADRAAAVVSRYAWGEDYHAVLRRRLEALLSWMREAHGRPIQAVCHVDTAPVQERLYAAMAGLGWIGKNTCLINPTLGSWLFLAGIIIDLPLETGAPEFDQCGTCTLCLDACPTGALHEPYKLDATRCLSYLTIEVRDRMPADRRADVGHHVYGCDICQDVCPYNMTAPASADAAWQPRGGLEAATLTGLWRLPDAELRRLMKGGPMGRSRVIEWRRNLAVALGNSGDPEAAAALDEPVRYGERPSLTHPLVQEHVAWARERLGRDRSTGCAPSGQERGSG